MFSMAITSTLLLTFLGGSSPGPDRGGAVGIGCGSGVTLCLGTSPGLSNEEEAEPVNLARLEQIPKVWVGIRVSTVPDALAAHLKRGALMIINVAENSPADQAGIELYDVVLSFNNREIGGMQALLEAIGESGPDKPATMVVIKGGEEKQLSVTPIQRDFTVTPTFKYEEQEVVEVDPLQRYFGHRLKIGPDGNILVMPQGRLDRLPDDIKGWLDEVPDIDWYSVVDDLPLGFSMDFEDDDRSTFRLFLDDEDADEDARITITVSENGESITIQRDDDGRFTVEREEAGGSRKSETYGDLHRFREQDPEAYQLYRRSTHRRPLSTIVIPPDLRDLDRWQREFELELKAKLDQAREGGRKNRRQFQHRNDDDGEVSKKTVRISVDDGRIRLTITEGGVTRKYDFGSRAEFEKSEPELYERYRSHLDE